MSHQDIIRAWKNPAYRNTLSPAEREALPANPAGTIEISDEILGQFAGGANNAAPHTVVCKTQIACTMFEECSNLGCPTRLCSLIDCGPPILTL